MKKETQRKIENLDKENDSHDQINSHLKNFNSELEEQYSQILDRIKSIKDQFESNNYDSFITNLNKFFDQVNLEGLRNKLNELQGELSKNSSGKKDTNDIDIYLKNTKKWTEKLIYHYSL